MGVWLLMLYLGGVMGTEGGGGGGVAGYRRLLRDSASFANYGNSVLLGPASPPPDLSTRINDKVLTDPTSSLLKAPPKYSFKSSVAGFPSPHKDIADILTNLQILNILTTQDAHVLAAHAQDTILGVPQHDPGTLKPRHQSALYDLAVAASHSPLEDTYYHHHYLDPHPAPQPAGPPPASPFALPPLHTPPVTQHESTASSEHYLPSPSSDSGYPAPSPAQPASSHIQNPSNPPHSPSAPVHSPSTPVHSPSPSPIHFTFDPIQPMTGPPPSSSTSQEVTPSPTPLPVPSDVDLSHIMSQLTEEDLHDSSTPSLTQLASLSHYLQWLRHQQQGAPPTEEMILASLLHQYNQQHLPNHTPPLPPTETPYVPALHGPFADPVGPPSPSASLGLPPTPLGLPPAPLGLPPAPPELSAVDVASLPQSDFLGASSSGGLSSCIEAGGCALLLASLLSLGLTTAIITPVALPALGFLGRRRRAVPDEGSTVLNYLKQHHSELLAAGIKQVEAEMKKPMDPALLQTLQEGDPHFVLPLLRQTLRSPAPTSLRLLRQICGAVAFPLTPPSEARLITAQECLLLAAARHL